MRRSTFITVLIIGITVLALGCAAGYACIRLWFPAEEFSSEQALRSGTPQNPEAAADVPPQHYESPSNPIAEEKPPSLDTSAQKPQYLLSAYEGYVTVFYLSDYFDATIKDVTDTPINALSTDERNRLSAGICIFDDEQLAKILQDYGS